MSIYCVNSIPEDVAVKVLDGKESAETLYFVDSITSFDDRMQDIGRATAKVLSAAGVDFGILGKGEKDSGNEVRRFGEEMLFRAFLIVGLAGLFGNLKAKWALALVGSSLLFGLAHYDWGPAGIIDTTIMGLVLGSIYLRSGGNLWITIIAHGLINTLKFSLIYAGVA